MENCGCFKNKDDVENCGSFKSFDFICIYRLPQQIRPKKQLSQQIKEKKNSNFHPNVSRAYL